LNFSNFAFFTSFGFSHCIFDFSNTLLHARIFLAFFPFYKNHEKISLSINSFGKSFW
jgi:hypothetical protein